MDDMLNAYIYEIKKGTKPMALITVGHDKAEKYLQKIKLNKLSCFVSKISDKVNIFFGNKECIDIVAQFSSDNLSFLSAHEDFMLGIMLGYNRIEQCRRYLNKINLYPVG